MTTLIGVRLATPGEAVAAPGSPLIIGSQANNSGFLDTQLVANSQVVTFKLYQQGPGTALMGYTTPISGQTRGVYGRVDSPAGDGIQARNAGLAGPGAALRAYGGNNDGVVATTGSEARYAVRATNEASGFDTGTGGAILADGAEVDGLVAATHGASAVAVRATQTGMGAALRATAISGHGIEVSTGGGVAISITSTGSAAMVADSAGGITSRSSGPNSRAVFGQSQVAGGVGVYGDSWSSSGSGVIGTNDFVELGQGTGVLGRSAGDAGVGVSGLSTNLVGAEAAGVLGTVYGIGSGVYGKGGTFAVRGETNKATGSGIYGVAPLYGVQAYATGSSGTGVYAEANFDGGSVIGVHGHTASTSGIGVKGSATRTSGVTYGVYGETSSASGFAGYFAGPLHGTSFLELDTGTPPAAPTGAGRLFVQLAGGKAQLCVAFPSGPIRVLATEA